MHNKTTSVTLGNDSFTQFGNQVLEGSVNFVNNSLSPLQQLFLKEQKKQTGILKSPLSKYITIKHISDEFNCWKESTSTSLFKRNLGHYKFLLTSDGNEHVKIIADFNASCFNSTTHWLFPLSQYAPHWQDGPLLKWSW